MRQVATDILWESVIDTIGNDPVRILAPDTEGELKILRAALTAWTDSNLTGVCAIPVRQGWSVQMDRPSLSLEDGGWARAMLRITDTTRVQPDLCAAMCGGGEGVTAPYAISILCHMAYTEGAHILIRVVGEIPDEISLGDRMSYDRLPVVIVD